MNMLEKAARAVALCFESARRCPFGEHRPDGFTITGAEIDAWQELCTAAASDVLKALREPSEKMIEAGAGGKKDLQLVACAYWRAMIDAALDDD